MKINKLSDRQLAELVAARKNKGKLEGNYVTTIKRDIAKFWQLIEIDRDRFINQYSVYLW